MAWPPSVITRQISFGKAVVLETGEDLSLRVTTRASRSLVSQALGFRMEKLSASFETAEVGGEVVFPLPVTNQAGWLDAETRLPISVGEEEHSHLYTTTLTIYSGSSTVASYTIGPYPIPQGAGILDGDTMLVPDGTQDGALVPIPEAWANIIADASTIAGLKGQPGGVAELDAAGEVPLAQLPLAEISRSPELSAAIVGEVETAVPPAVAEAIADDETVVLAAAAAVDTAVADAVVGLPVVSAVAAGVVTDAAWTQTTTDYYPSTYPSTYAGGALTPMPRSATWPVVDESGHIDDSVIPETIARVEDVEALVGEALDNGDGGGVASPLTVGVGFAVPSWGQSPVAHSTGSAFVLTGHLAGGAADLEPGAVIVSGGAWAAGRKVTAQGPTGVVLLQSTGSTLVVAQVLSGGSVPWLSLDGVVVASAG